MKSLLGATIALVLAAAAGPAIADGTLFIGTDENTFNGVLPDQLGVATVSGASLVSETNHATTFHINGMTDVSGQNFLYAGDPFSDLINKVSYTGALISSTPITGMGTSCCNEDMIWTGTQLYHAQFDNGVQLIDVTTGTILSTESQPDVVGMAFAKGQIWITHWAGREVGIWDPTTNVFTPEFSTPSNAGGLAYDPVSGTMWVGQAGGTVVPYTLSGLALNAGFQPFGATSSSDTIDGLAFLGEAAPRIPEPSTWAMLLLGFASLGVLAYRRSARRLSGAVST
ncbi:MAG: PEP-CTERM sorting domain-containing protein [Roseiarcus sp.]